MKQVSIILTIILVLGSFFYGLSIISSDNTCTSVRRYLAGCQKPAITPAVETPKISETPKAEPITVPVAQEKTLDYALVSYILINTSSYFVGGYETGFEKIIDKNTFYEVIYSGKDSVIVDIAKEKNKVIRVVINGKNLSSDEIKNTFSKYY